MELEFLCDISIDEEDIEYLLENEDEANEFLENIL